MGSLTDTFDKNLCSVKKGRYNIMKTKPEVINIIYTGGRLIKLLDTELGTALVVGKKIKLNTFPGGDATESSFPWNTSMGDTLCNFIVDELISANVTIESSGFIKYEIQDEKGNRVAGIVNANNVKLSTMCREISDGEVSTRYIANAMITEPKAFEDLAYKLAELLENFGK